MNKTYQKGHTVSADATERLVNKIREAGGTDEDLKRATGMTKLGYLADNGREKQVPAATYNALVMLLERLQATNGQTAIIRIEARHMPTFQTLVGQLGGTFTQID